MTIHHCLCGGNMEFFVKSARCYQKDFGDKVYVKRHSICLYNCNSVNGSTKSHFSSLVFQALLRFREKLWTTLTFQPPLKSTIELTSVKDTWPFPGNEQDDSEAYLKDIIRTSSPHEIKPDCAELTGEILYNQETYAHGRGKIAWFCLHQQEKDWCRCC